MICRSCTIALALLGVVLAAGCATSYQRSGATGGYSDTHLQTNLFAVSFEGIGYTRRGRATDLALLRCAELTICHGFKYFVILDSAVDSSTAYFTTPSSYTTTASVQSYGSVAYGNATTYGGSGVTVPIVKPSASFSIMCFDERPAGPWYAYDADFLLHSVASKYGFKIEGGKVMIPKPKQKKRFSVQSNRWE